MPHLIWFTLAGLMFTACFPSSASALGVRSGALARKADSLVDSIGVNTHIGYGDTAYGDYAGRVKPSLLYLGVRHIRDGLADDGPGGTVFRRYHDLLGSGIRLTGVTPYKTASMPALISLIRAQREVLEAVEGPNETDIFTQFSYRGRGFPQGTAAFMKDFYPAIRRDPVLRSLPVLQTTLAFPGAETGRGVRADLLGDLSAFADYGNSHNYFAFGKPPGETIRTGHLPLNSRITPGKPMMSSEGGYQMGDGDGYRGGWDDGLSAPFSEDIHGRYLLRYVLEQYRLGYTRSFIYELLDIDQPQWGLFRADGMPRPAASGLRHLIRLLGEGRWNASARRWNVPSFTPRTLSYTLSAAPVSVHHLLLQKSNGTFYLLLWNEVNNWNAVKGKPLYPKAVPLTLNIGQPVRRVRTFLPLTRGMAVTSTSNAPRLHLTVPDHPVIVEIKPE